MSNYTVALSGLQNTSLAIDAVSNNIANANTVGYKAGEYVFADQFMKAVNPADSARVGMGTQALGVRRPMLQGTITNSVNPLDLAISGKGMFRLLQGSGDGNVDPSAVYYSRNGQFRVDKQGYIVNENGMYLTGYQPSLDGNSVTDDFIDGGVDKNGIQKRGRLIMPDSNLPGNETTKSQIAALLDSTGSAFTSTANVEFDPTQATYNNKTTQTVFDNEGNTHTLEVYYRRVSDSTLTITSEEAGYTYSPGPSSKPNTLGQTKVTINPNSVLRVDTPCSASSMSATASTSDTLVMTAAASSAGQPFNVSGYRVFVNGVDSGATVVGGGTTDTLDLSRNINVPNGAGITFYPDNGQDLDMTLIAPDGTEISVQGSTNQKGSNADLTTTMAVVEAYASIDGRFYNVDELSSSGWNLDPQTQGVLGHRPVSELRFVGGRNIDSLVTDTQSGNPVFSTVTKLSTRVTNNAGGSSDLVFDLDLSDTTLQAGAFQVVHSTQNGEPLARLTNVTVDNAGRIVGVYGTGKLQYVGQLALVHFEDAEGLIPIGKNAFAASVISGTEGSAQGIVVGRAGTGIFGDVKGQALEASNVDLANELVRLMVLQRSYSANSQSMKAFDQTLRDTLQMIG